MGGLGIMDIQIMNRALLTKMIWKWIKDETWLIQDLYMDATTIRPWLMTPATPFWKSLQKLDDFVNISMQMEIGNGERTRFWLDNWQGNILRWEQDTNISITGSWQNNNWVLYLKESLSQQALQQKRMLNQGSTANDLHPTQ
jgi:hypothetical protein